MTRRTFLRGGVLGAGALASAYTYFIEPHWLRVVERVLDVAHLPDQLVGKKFVQISDLHIGRLVDDDYISAAIAQACELADAMVLTGDFMSCDQSEELDHVARILEASVKVPPLGIFAVLGNHDYGRRWSQVEAADGLVRHCENIGIQVLRNEQRDLHGLKIVGIDDLWSPNFMPLRAMSGLRDDDPALVLCHNPDAADRNVWGAYRGWMLSGHTHGGQCKPPFLPPPILPVNNRRYTSGAIAIDEHRRVYINPGLGYLRRVRFNVRPEITVHTLARART